jgi:AcrR family transcriptional regulator
MRSDARRNRERVLAAARECFGRDGLDAQMDDIAACAGVGVGTVYRHFATKDALLEALAADHFNGLTDIAERALTVEDPWEGFATYFREGADMMGCNRALAQVTADRPEVMNDAALRADVERDLFTKVEQMIVRAQEAGALRPEFELSDVPALMCSLGALQISQAPYQNWRRLLAIVLDGLRAPGVSELPPITGRIPRRDV